MIPLLRTVVFGVAVFGYLISVGQPLSDSTTLLNEVVIERQRIEDLAIGHYTLKPGENTFNLGAAVSAADLLRKFGYGHLRSYGPGGLATLSLRGTGAGHSSVMWNGLPLQSPLNGQLDLSQVPVFFLDDAELQMGGSASINGSGAIGGTLHLNSRAQFGEGLTFTGIASAASFDTWFGGLGQQWSDKKFSTDTRLFLIDSKNNFPFTNNNLTPARQDTREHASYRQTGFLHQDYWQPADNWLLQLRVWMQDNYSELPSQSFVFSESESDQRDQFIRSMISAQFTPGKTHFNFQSSYTHHTLLYRQDLSTPTTTSTFDSFVNSLEATFFSTPETEFTGGLNYTVEDGNADELSPSDILRNRVAAFAAIKYSKLNKWITVLSARQEVINGVASPFAPSLGTEFYAPKNLKLTGSASRNYRIPTMNDLYWLGVGAEGNAALRPEDSWSEEVAVHYNKAFGDKYALILRGTVFSNQADNWILWQPEATVWSPDNIKKVWSRGSEAQTTLKFVDGSWSTSVVALYSFTKSTTSEVYDPFAANEIGNQLIYTPIHEGSITLDARWKKWQATAILNMTGLQYTDGDNNPALALDSYHTLNFWLNYLLTGKKVRSTVIVEVNNVFDKSYEIREGYPMPGRNYRLSLNFRIK